MPTVKVGNGIFNATQWFNGSTLPGIDTMTPTTNPTDAYGLTYGPSGRLYVNPGDYVYYKAVEGYPGTHPYVIRQAAFESHLQEANR